jgi:hypothetical protein
MPIASFHALCTGLCAGLGEPPPHLRNDTPAGQPPALHLAVSDVACTVAAARQPGGGPGALIEVDFGEVPPGREESMLQSLMDTNLRMMAADATAFVRSPEGRIVLLSHWPLDRMELHEAQEILLALADEALAWRRGAARETGPPPRCGFA